MRFEAKHNYFKKLAVRLGNFINIAYTLALRHQCLSCYYSLDKNSLGDPPEIGPGTVVAAFLLVLWMGQQECTSNTCMSLYSGSLLFITPYILYLGPNGCE